MPVKVNNETQLPFTDMKGLLTLIKQGSSLSSLAKSYESKVGNITEEEVLELSSEHYLIMLKSIENGLAGTYYKDRILQAQSQLIADAEERGKLIPSTLINDILASVTAIMETKSSMGVIVAAPTAGSCATLAGTLIPVARIMGKDENDICESILAAGLLGIMIDYGAGFAAEEGGCQYECGSASGMTAAALVELAGGTPATALSAASMALQNTLGMICDPVADRVEVPCLGKNILAAMNALSAANMALAGYNELIPLDEVINSMREVANNMDHRYRCTCKGGLSITPTAIDLFKSLNKR
jgi:L-serine dehydratase